MLQHQEVYNLHQLHILVHKDCHHIKVHFGLIDHPLHHIEWRYMLDIDRYHHPLQYNMDYVEHTHVNLGLTRGDAHLHQIRLDMLDQLYIL